MVSWVHVKIINDSLKEHVRYFRLFYHNTFSLREIVLPKMNAVMLLVMKND